MTNTILNNLFRLWPVYLYKNAYYDKGTCIVKLKIPANATINGNECEYAEVISIREIKGNGVLFEAFDKDAHVRYRVGSTVRNVTCFSYATAHALAVMEDLYDKYYKKGE